MEFIITNYKFSGKEWIKIQNNALKFLQESKNIKITQQSILDFAKNGLIAQEKQKLFHNQVSDKSSEKIFFMGIPENINSSVAELSFDLKTYFVNYDYLNQINFDFEPQRKFNPDLNQEKINDFIKQYIEENRFKEIKTEQAIQTGDIVKCEFFDIKTQRKEQFELIAQETENHTVEKLLLNKKVNDKFEFKANDNFIIDVTILEVSYLKKEKLTDENVRKLGIQEITDINSLKIYIEKTVKEDILSNEIFNYGYGIIKQLYEQKLPFEFPEDLITSDIEGFAFDNNFQGDPRTVVLDSLAEYLWLNAISKKFDLMVHASEIKREEQKIKANLPIHQHKQINIKRIADGILFQKIGAIYLNKLDKNLYESVKENLVYKN
ncbi:trigger factor-related chaperone [Mycoplasmopsis felis]|uniref:trigger factor-related chaperone n=1 Tax=Mycoplasmopsis felis TaxID=33923 RepID=UPI002AFF093F|nr:hypothetical protein [Mycoplasmopsis felis]WQQ07116.1 hypothetical protein RRG37_00575 [Mycoplasmopsis felis]